MKRALLIFASLVGITSFLWFGVAQAADLRSGEAPAVPKDEIVNGSLYITGRTVVIEGTVQGDVFCAGEKVEIKGTVEGDVLCAGQNLTIGGVVNGDVRSAGEMININGQIDGSATLMGRLVTFDKKMQIGRDLTLFAQESKLDGQLGRDLLGGGETLNIAGNIGRHVDFEAQNLKIEDSVLIGGDLIYTSNKDAEIGSKAEIAGTTERRTPEQPNTSQTDFAISMMFGFACMLIIGLALLLLAPRLLDATGQNIRKYHFWTLGAGLLVLVATPIVSIFLLITAIGMPLAILLMLLWVVALMLSVVLAAHALGQIIFQKLDWQNTLKRLTSLGIGLLVLFLLALIPVVGAFVLFVALIWGMGSIVMLIGHQLRPIRVESTPTKPAKKVKKAAEEK